MSESRGSCPAQNGGSGTTAPVSPLHKDLSELTHDERTEYLSRHCQHPVRMERRFGKGKGFLLVNCGSSRSEECVYCAEQGRLAKLDVAFSGFKGENAHRVNDCYHFYVTYTLPSFGKVHRENDFSVRDAIFRGTQKNAHICPCGKWHFEGSGYAGVPLSPETYRYAAQVFANHELGRTFHFARKYLNDAIMGRGGPPLDYYAVTEMHRRAAAHKHVIYSVPVDVVRTFGSDENKAVATLVSVFKASARVRHWTGRGRIGFGSNCDVDVIPPLPHVPTEGDVAAFKLAVHRTLTYVVKYLGKGGPAAELERGASSMQMAHYRRLKAAGYAQEYKPRTANNFGCRGHSMSRSKTWGIRLADVHQRRRNYRAQREADELGISVAELSARKETGRTNDAPPDGFHFDALSRQKVFVLEGACYDVATGARLADYKFRSTRKPKTLNQLRQYRENGFSELDYVGSDSSASQVQRLASGRPRLGLDDLEKARDDLRNAAPRAEGALLDALSRRENLADRETPSGALEIVIAYDQTGHKSLESLQSVRMHLDRFPPGETPVYVTYLGRRAYMGHKGNSKTRRLVGRMKQWRGLDLVSVSVRE